MTGDASEDAAWRDLVAHYATPAVDGAPGPWPTREDLAPPGTEGTEATGQDASGPDTADLDTADLDLTGPEGPEPDEAQSPGPRRAVGPGPFGGIAPGPPQIRIVRPATPVTPPDDDDHFVPPAPPPDDDDHFVPPAPPPDDDDHFVPPAPPPLPRLDPVTKGAWAALFGGPLYLLVAVIADWQVPNWAAFCAVAAFVGGFATLVVRMGDRPPRDSGPDDGAVV